MNRRPSPRSNENSRDPDERLRLRVRAARRTSTESECADSLGRPVGGEGLADDPRARDGSPEAAVVGGATVVAHHEVVTGGNRHFMAEIAPVGAPAGCRE